jgi:autotransporter-associated beta strand protein
MNPLNKIALITLVSISFFPFTTRVEAQAIFDATGGSSWMKASNPSKASNTNWSSGGTYSGPPGVSDIAEFGADFTSSSNGIQTSPFGPNITATNSTTDLGTSTASLGGPAGTAGAEDVNTEAVGAISAISGLPMNFYIGNPSSDTAPDFLELNGATINSVPSTIISNASGYTLNIEGTYSGQTNPMGVVLGNTTNVIQGTGNIVVSANIYEKGSPSAITSQGSNVTLSGANQYSGGTTISAGSLIIGSTTGVGTGVVSISGGALSATTTNVSIGGLLTLGSGSLTLNAASELVLGQNLVMSGGTLVLANSSGSIAGSGGEFTISGGTLNLDNSITNYSQDYDVLSGFNATTSTVSDLTITGYSNAYMATLSDNGELSFVAAVPEPNGFVLLLGGVVLLVGIRAVRRRNAAVAGVAAVVALGLLGAGKAAAQSLFTQGDIVVSIYGDAGNSGSSSASTIEDGQPTPITLDEFTPTISADADATTPIVAYTLPTSDGVGGSSNVGVVGEYGSSSEGTLQLSGNNDGYIAPSASGNSNDLALAQAPDNDVPRVAVLVDANGNVNSSTQLNDVYDQENIRGVYSANGSSVYVSGQTQSNYTPATQGIFYTYTGNDVAESGTAPTQIYSSTAVRDVQEYTYIPSGSSTPVTNLYFSVDAKAITSGDVSPGETGIFEYSGTPTTAPGSAPIAITTPTATMLVNGVSETVNLSPEGFFFANSTTLYVADTGSPKQGGKNAISDGGIQKWTENTTTGVWTLDYTITGTVAAAGVTPTAGQFVNPANTAKATTGQSGFEAITGEVVGTGPTAVVDIFAVSYTLGDDDPDGLYGVVDNLDSTTEAGGETALELASAPGGVGGYDYKGVSFAPEAVPEPSTWLLLAPALLGFAWFHRRRNQAA